MKTVSAAVLARGPKLCNFLEMGDVKVVYKRYASLYFCMAVDPNDNELNTLEVIHQYVEILDRCPTPPSASARFWRGHLSGTLSARTLARRTAGGRTHLYAWSFPRGLVWAGGRVHSGIPWCPAHARPVAVRVAGRQLHLRIAQLLRPNPPCRSGEGRTAVERRSFTTAAWRKAKRVDPGLTGGNMSGLLTGPPKS
jgi:hypothetical protein